jgi:hypothetical protein
VRWATLASIGLAVVACLAACNDVREFRGTWQGSRVGDAAVLRVGPGDAATLVIDDIDTHGIQARLAIEGLLPETSITSLPGAEADALANMTFAGSPLRVYLTFLAVPDAGGDALVLIALYDDRRVEVRVLRGGPEPLYAIFALEDSRS